MTAHSTIIENAYLKSAQALGIETAWDKDLTATMKRRDAAQALADLQPRDAAQELMAAPNPRTWDSILAEIATHNLRVAEAKAAIRGRLLSTTTAQLDAQLKAFLPQYADQAHDSVSGILAALTDAAADVPTLNAETAVQAGYGDRLTEFHKHAHRIRQHTALGAAVAPTGRIYLAANALAMVCDPGKVNPIRKTEPTRYNMGGEDRSTGADLARRDQTRNLIGEWLGDESNTLRRLARGEHPGFDLSAATSKDYADRVQQFLNSDRIIRVAD